MSILIKGMEIPDHCINCPFMISRDGDDCILQSEEANSNFKNWEQMKENCPLVEVKMPHRRLIDADALIKALIRKEPFNDCARVVIAECMEEVRHAPTVIGTEGK